MASSRSDCLIGLIRLRAMPKERARALNPARSAEESSSTGTWANAAFSRIIATVSRPSISGIIRSISTRSKGDLAEAAEVCAAASKAAMAAEPLSTSSASISQLFRISSRIRRLVAWSSTTKTFSPCSETRSARLVSGVPNPKRTVQ